MTQPSMENEFARGLPPRVALAVKTLDPGDRDLILEVGCGPGLACGPLLHRYPRTTYLGLDRSGIAAAAFGRYNAALIDAGRAHFIQADLVKDDVRLEAGVGFAVNVNAFWTNQDRAFSSMRKLMTANSRLLLVYEAPSAAKASSIGAILERYETTHFVKLSQILWLGDRTIALNYGTCG